jgi:hypothetical protein
MMTLYNKFRSVPESAKKEIKGGRLKGMTDINPMWRIKTLTEQFGPCGIGWYYTIDRMWSEEGAKGEKAVFAELSLYLRQGDGWSYPVKGIGGSTLVASESSGLRTNDECYKMALTDAISVACKALGMGADVYWEKDRTKYDLTPQEPSIPCDGCGKLIASVKKRDGSMWAVSDMAVYSQTRYGRKLCAACMKQEEKKFT